MVTLKNMFLYLSFFDILFLKEGYTFLNTLIYIFLVVIGFFVLFRFFKKNTRIDFLFIRTIVPFLLLGATLRIFEQERYISGFFSFLIRVPGLLVFLCVLYILCFIITKKIKKQNKVLLELIGYTFLAPFLLFVLLNITNFFYFLIIILITIKTTFLFSLFFKKTLSNKTNKLVFLSQTLDGVATTIGLIFYSDVVKETHFLSNILVTIHPFLFLAIKLGLVLLFLYTIEHLLENNQLITYTKALIIIHGLLIGFRSLLTISLL